MRGIGLAVIAGVVVLVVGGCGEDREGSFTSEDGTGTETTGTATTGTGTTGTAPTTTPSGTPTETFSIAETEFELRPANFALGRAGVVAFVVRNEGSVVHALEVEGPTGEVETEEIQPGKRAKLKADVGEPGTYELYCPIGDHKERGMVGTLVVGGGEAGEDRGGGESEGGGDDDGGGAGARGY